MANPEIISNVDTVAYLDHGPRVGRSQGTGMFWGLVSVFFAAAACFYFWENLRNESAANKARDEVMSLEEERATLNAQKEKLQASLSERETQVKTHEDFLADKETKLAAEEARLEALDQQLQNPAPPGQAQTVTIRKFSDVIGKLGKDQGAEIITRGGRPVLRVANTVFFAPGDTTLTPDGMSLLAQIAQSLAGQSDHFELRIDSFTDPDAEKVKAPGDAAKAPDGTVTPGAWELTSARAEAILRYYREQSSLPFQNVLVIARGDSEPIVANAKGERVRNQRLEITIVPVAPPFHPTPVDSADAAGAAKKSAKAPTP